MKFVTQCGTTPWRAPQQRAMCVQSIAHTCQDASHTSIERQRANRKNSRCRQSALAPDTIWSVFRVYQAQHTCSIQLGLRVPFVGEAAEMGRSRTPPGCSTSSVRLRWVLQDMASAWSWPDPPDSHVDTSCRRAIHGYWTCKLQRGSMPHSPSSGTRALTPVARSSLHRCPRHAADLQRSQKHACAWWGQQARWDHHGEPCIVRRRCRTGPTFDNMSVACAASPGQDMHVALRHAPHLVVGIVGDRPQFECCYCECAAEPFASGQPCQKQYRCLSREVPFGRNA